jgi:hypothetical protein
MEILRVNLQGSKVALFLLFALSSALIMTISTPRAASAEGPLLGTVRCLVRSVLLTDCQPQRGSTRPSEPSNAAQPSSSNAKTNTAAKSDKAKGAPTPSREEAYAPLPETMAMPSEPSGSMPGIPSPTATSAYADMTKAEYLAYFNKYSKYAVAGAHDEAAAPVPVERTGEGWRFFGIAWYWWALAGVFIGAIIYAVRQRFLRKSSVLPGMS